MALDAMSPDHSTWPVLVIDEANVLMGWDKHPVERDALLRFLVQIAKQKNCCHVLMATSEYGFQTWLNESKWYSVFITLHCNTLCIVVQWYKP